MIRMWPFLTVATLWLVLFAPPAPAADISAGTMAAVSDLLSNAAPDRPPAGADPDTWRKAVEALKKEGLAGAARPPQPGNNALLQAYANALLLGPRAREFRDQVGAVHDAVLGGDAGVIGNAIRALYVSAGRAAPADAALAPLVAAARNIGGDAPSETINHAIERPGYRIDIVDAPAARSTAVEVVVNDGPDGKPARVLFDGTTRTGAKAGGEGLDRRTEAAPPCTMDERSATELRAKLNGEWRGANGTVTVSGSGNSITISELNRAGRRLRYEGSYRLGKIDARHAITHADDIDASLPAAIRGQLAGMGLFFTLRLETCRNPGRLTGRWGSQHVTYDQFMQVNRVHDPYDRSYVMSRELPTQDYRIARLHISYDAWEAAQSQLRAQLELAKEDLKRAEERLRQENSAYDERRARTAEAHRAFIAAERNYQAAGAAVIGYTPADAAKPEHYRKLEQNRGRLARRVDMLYDGIISITEGGNVVEPAAFENYQRLQAELDGIDADLARLDGELGFNAERDRLGMAATDAFAPRVGAESALNGAVTVQDQARAREDEADVAHSEAQAKLSGAEQALARFTDGAIRVSGVSAEHGAVMKYETVYWDPREVLQFLNDEIARLGQVLDQAARARRDTRAEFLDTQQRASELQNALADAIWTSAKAQSGVELAFNFVDVFEKTLEAGPIGAIGEGGKKLVEAVILGPPSFYEPAMAPEVLNGDGGVFAEIRNDVNAALQYAAKRGFKTGVTGQAASVVVKKYILARDTSVYRELIGDAFVSESHGQRAQAAFKAMNDARKKYQAAVREGAFPKLSGLVGNSLKDTLKNAAKDPKLRKLGYAVGKDIAKWQIKEQVGEWIEGAAMRAYVAAEAQARVATQIFLAASGVYWESYDPYQARVAERREILRQYDPNNHMQIKKDERFPGEAEILVVLRDLEGRPLPLTDHAIAVTLGGRLPKEVAGDAAFFVFDATDLQHDGSGGVTLEIAVER